MSNGIWVVFEGPDGVGKSTTMHAVANLLRERDRDIEIIETKHPGSTPLGQHIRNLVKDPGQYGFTIDPLSSQMLMFTDHINFKSTVLIPALERGAIILADRCNLVSGLVYGSATGLDVIQINALMGLVCTPRVDMLYVLCCAPNIQNERLAHRGGTDRFETSELRQKVNLAYDRLLTGMAERTIMMNKIVALENVQYIDTDRPISDLARRLANEIRTRYLSALEGG